MKNYALALAAVILLIILSAAGQQKQRSDAPVVIRTRADAVQAMAQIQSEMAELDQHQQKCYEAAQKLAELYSGLSQKADAVARRAAGALKPPKPGNTGMISSSSGSDTSGQLMAATQQMQETQMSFNLQYLQLQETMQNENRQYTMVSNIMKTKHDTVKNSISNIR
jgi:hypothetical protein